MKNQSPTASDNSRARAQAAQELLRDAFVTTPAVVAPNFRANVWARINARKNPSTWAQWLRHHVTGVTVATAACVFVAAVCGGWLALEQNRSQQRQQLMLYLSSIDAHQRLATESNAQPTTLR